jgi:tRNA pseudouridine32 synthase/23S rRNA pseudouridine746 synthase
MVNSTSKPAHPPTLTKPLLNYSPPLNPQFDIVYKDDDLIVFNKPSGLLTVPGKALEHKDSLQTRAQRVWPTASIVHRLDMATSGLLIMALHKESHRHISKQFELRQVQKIYYARVLGVPAHSQGDVDLPLICDWPNRPKQMVDHERGKPAFTHWELIEHNNTSSLIKLTPSTGRSHQLRVHMLALGHAILGDKLYACEQGKAMSERLCLHAQSIEFLHPITNCRLQFDVPFDFG